MITQSDVFSLLLIYLIGVFPSTFIISLVIHFITKRGFWKTLFQLNITFIVVILLVLMATGG